MNDVQELLAGLQSKGWTLTAIADEFGISRNAVDSWRSGKHKPRQSVVVQRELKRLLGRKRIPKRWRTAFKNLDNSLSEVTIEVRM